MRLVVLIIIAALIVVGAAAAYVQYTRWQEHRYDGIIYDAAREHDLDPALVKALIRVQAMFPLQTDEQLYGLMQVSQRAEEQYLRAHGKDAWGYICIHRSFRNHDPAKPEEFTSSNREEQNTCQARGCGQVLVPEQVDPRTNLDFGCWSLRYIEELIRQQTPRLPPHDIQRRAIIAYRYGLPRGSFTTTAEQDRFLREVFRHQLDYQPDFERLARRRAAE